MKIIVGGGIAGLWLALECQSRGIACCVLEQGALGQAQTLASQGMIHGGTKYALDGVLSQAATVIGAMPSRWLDALAGRGSVNLAGVQLHRSDQLLWSTDSLTSQLVGFFASKAMASRMQRIHPDDEPGFGDAGFRGMLYRLNEPVIDVASCLSVMSEQLHGCIFQAQVQSLVWKGDRVIGVETDGGRLDGDTVILTAGEGTEALLADSPHQDIRMQRRPLAMVAARLVHPTIPIFGHHIGFGSKPKLTVSTHHAAAHQTLYLGGQLAEDGVNLSDDAQITQGIEALQTSIGWRQFDIIDLSVIRVTRAEPATGQGHRPDTAAVFPRKGLIVAWPTKLALAPALADDVLSIFQGQETATQRPAWSTPGIGQYPWH